MAAITLTINGQDRQVDVPDDMPLLWVLRDRLDLTGTKFGCGIGACGACTVHLEGVAVRSCQIPAVAAKNPSPSDADIDSAMSGNICRCGTYQRIRRAIHRAAEAGATS